MNGHMNGHTNGTKLANGALSPYGDQHAVNEIRKFVIDICRQNGGGHGGSGQLILESLGVSRELNSSTSQLSPELQ